MQSDNVEARHSHPHLKELGHYIFQSGNNLSKIFAEDFVLIAFILQQVPQWGPELIEKEYHAKQTAEVLFFVLDRQTRCVATIIEAAYYTAAQKTFVLVIHPYEGPGQLIQGEPISQR